jgi:hypothetical protein
VIYRRRPLVEEHTYVASFSREIESAVVAAAGKVFGRGAETLAPDRCVGVAYVVVVVVVMVQSTSTSVRRT